MAGSSEKYHHNSNGDPHVDLNRPPATGGAAVAVAATSTSVADSNSLGAPLTSSSSSTIFVGDSDQQTPLAQGRSSSSLGRQRHRRGSSSQDLEDSDPGFLASVASAEAKLEGVARRANPSRSPTRHRPSSPSSSPLDPPSSHQPQSQPSEGALKPLPLSAPLHALGDKTGSSDTYWADGLNDVLHHTFDVNYERKSGNTSRNSDGVGVGSVSYNPMNNSSNIRGGGFINGGGISSSSGGMSMNSAGAARAAKATATSSPSMSSGAAGLSPVAPPPEPQSAAAAAWGLGVVLPQPATDPITRMPCVLTSLRIPLFPTEYIYIQSFRSSVFCFESHCGFMLIVQCFRALIHDNHVLRLPLQISPTLFCCLVVQVPAVVNGSNAHGTATSLHLAHFSPSKSVERLKSQRPGAPRAKNGHLFPADGRAFHWAICSFHLVRDCWLAYLFALMQ